MAARRWLSPVVWGAVVWWGGGVATAGSSDVSITVVTGTEDDWFYSTGTNGNLYFKLCASDEHVKASTSIHTVSYQSDSMFGFDSYGWSGSSGWGFPGIIVDEFGYSSTVSDTLTVDSSYCESLTHIEMW